MNYKLLNMIIADFIDKYVYDVDEQFRTSEKLAIKILNTNPKKITTEDFSRKVTLDDCVNIIYDYFKSFDENMANQFMNLLYERKDDGKPYVKFIPSFYNPKVDSHVDKDGNVFIVYDDSVYDIFLILHELLHKMNMSYLADMDDNGNLSDTYETNSSYFLGETVSITFEYLIGRYLVDNRIITENDFNLHKNLRLRYTKSSAESLIVESELIKLYLRDGYIDFVNLSNLLNSRDERSMVGKVLRKEGNTYSCIKNILKKKEMNIFNDEKYVVAQVLSKELLTSGRGLEDALWLHYEVGNVDSDFDLVFDELNEEFSDILRK